VCSMTSSTFSNTNVLHARDTIASDTTTLPDATEALMELRNHQHLALSAFIHTSTPSNKTAPACRHRARSSSPTPELPLSMPIAARVCSHLIAAGNGAKQNEQVATTDTDRDEADDDCGNDDQQCWKGALVKGCSERGQRIQRKAVQSAQDARLARALHEQWSYLTNVSNPRKRPRLSSALSRQPISTSVSSVIPLVA